MSRLIDRSATRPASQSRAFNAPAIASKTSAALSDGKREDAPLVRWQRTRGFLPERAGFTKTGVVLFELNQETFTTAAALPLTCSVNSGGTHVDVRGQLEWDISGFAMHYEFTLIDAVRGTEISGRWWARGVGAKKSERPAVGLTIVGELNKLCDTQFPQ